jgi:hypothetical protein
MKDHKPHLPPPPPPRRPNRPHASTEQSKPGRAIPPPTADWLNARFDAGGRDIRSLFPLPSPWNSKDERGRPPSADHNAQPEPPERTRVEKPSKEMAEGRSELNVPIVCARNGGPFVVVFRRRWIPLGTRYKFERALNLPQAGGSATPLEALTVPIDQLDWDGIKCPNCQSCCGPIHCGRCKKLVCYGRTTETADGTYFRCAPSCGLEGYTRPTLESVEGSRGQAPRSKPATAPASSRAPRLAPPKAPPSVPKLPKLR